MNNLKRNAKSANFINKGIFMFTIIRKFVERKPVKKVLEKVAVETPFEKKTRHTKKKGE